MSRNTKRKRIAESRSLKKKVERLGITKMSLIKSVLGQSGCKICPPFKDENSVGEKHSKYGKTKRKYKSKDRSSLKDFNGR